MDKPYRLINMGNVDTKYFVHASSYVDEGAQIGEGTKIWHFSHIFSGAVIGINCNIGQNVVIHATACVGSNVKIQNNVSIYDGVILEDAVFCGPSCVFTNVTNPRSEINRQGNFEKTLVKKGASIGANATIRCGVTIGEYAFVGAGTVVLEDVPPYAMVVGNPARQKAWMCQCGRRINFVTSKLSCELCKRSYMLTDNGLALETPS